jgi:hypothetical protein
LSSPVQTKRSVAPVLLVPRTRRPPQQ